MLTDCWYSPLERAIAKAAGEGAFIAGFPEYRPDLVCQLADGLTLQMHDFRQEVMLPAGANAPHLPLQTVDEFVEEHTAAGGLILHNGEALLSTKPETERAAWLSRFLARPWPTVVVLPIVLFLADVDPDHPNVVRFDAESLPELSLLMRLHAIR
jgi:hypothetical protein